MTKSVGWLDKFQNKIIALLVVSTLIPVLILGFYSVTSTTETISQLSVNLIEQETAQRSTSIVNFLQRIGEDVLFLREMPPVQGIIRARDNKGVDKQDNSSYEAWVNRLNTIFIGMMKNRPYYYQISYLNEKGNEMVRINSERGSLQAVSGADMQNKAGSDSFKETIKLGEGELYFSEVSLNQERGKIEIPYNPVIEVGTPIYSAAGKRKGIIVAKVFAKYFLAAKSGNLQQEDKTIFVLNSRGYYLSHPDPEKEYGLELKTEQNVTKDYPEIIGNKLLSGGHGLITEGTEYLLSYYTLYPNSKRQKNPLIFVAQLSKQKVFASIDSFKTVGINISIISLGVVLGLGIIIVRNIVNLIRQLTGAVSSFSVQVVSTLEEQERLSSQQSSSVQETTVTMEELNASAQKSALQADAAATGAKVALSKVEDGNESVQQALLEMETLTAKVEEIADKIGRLSEQANQIGTISKAVSDLANQTNMLALNAAVEAVRAGESGKGFSVVAKEIRSLADRSKKSAQTINTLVLDIQRAVAATVRVTEEGKTNMDMVVKISQKTAEAFSGVGEGMDGIVTNTQQIAFNAKQQAVAIQQVVDVMNALNQGAAEAATGIQETKAGTQQLREAALRLKEAV